MWEGKGDANLFLTSDKTGRTEMKREQKGTPLTPERVFIDHMLANTVRLVRNARHFPHKSGVASGVLVYREDRPLLVTAGHIFTAGGPWTLETNLISNEGVLHVALRDLQRIVSLDLGSGELAEIDMAWASIDPEDVRAGSMAAQGAKARAVTLPCYRGPLDAMPTPDRVYGFAAWNRVEFHKDLGRLHSECSYEIGLTYSRTRDNDVYVFRLARPHQGHTYYRGASGAPVADEEGRIVGVLLGGCKRQRELYVAPLARYYDLFDLNGA